MAENKTTWTTSITQIEPNRVAVRGYNIADLMDRVSFGAVVHLILRGELPSPPIAKLMDAILVSSIDHGVTPPSVLAARNAASTGATLSGCVASGILAINEYHGGAIEKCALQLGHIARQCEERGEDLYCVAEAMIEEMKAAGERMSGFGHRVHMKDPRTKKLFELAAAAGIHGPHMQAAAAVEKVFASAGKALPINVDGAIGAILADLGFEPQVMNGMFMIARVPGLIAHAHEEKSKQKPMRKIDAAAHTYDGPPLRKVEPRG